MSKQKGKRTKEEENQRIKDLQDRKKRDAVLNYQYSPCPYCGEAVRWRFPKGKEDEKDKYEPKHCRKEDCQKKFMDEMIARKKEKNDKKD